jgi:hypothetical protein
MAVGMVDHARCERRSLVNRIAALSSDQELTEKLTESKTI